MLLVSFLGSPCSGKTTTMLKLSAKMKEGGVPLEFLGEYAREFIHRKKAEAKRAGVKFNSSLTNEEQWTIMQTQFLREDLALESFENEDVTNGIVISDGSPLNSMLYMTPEFRSRPEVRDMTKKIFNRENLLFYNHPFDHPTYLSAKDPNRIHNRKQSEAINAMIPDMLKEWGVKNYYALTGSPETRLSRAYQAVNQKIEYLLKQKYATSTVSSEETEE